MITDENLKKLKIQANQAVEDQGNGVVITLAMDPAVVFAMAAELLRLRRLQEAFETVRDAGIYD